MTIPRRITTAVLLGQLNKLVVIVPFFIAAAVHVLLDAFGWASVMVDLVVVAVSFVVLHRLARRVHARHRRRIAGGPV